MRKLLAPNGNTSNLNEKQYKIVRTPAFKKWFGNWEVLAEAKSLSNDIKGVYKLVALNDIEQFLFEISQQANNSKSERSGAIETVGKRMVELALELFPNSKVGDEFIPVVSKVVDDNGEPLILWHGTKKEFTVFGKDKVKGIDLLQNYLHRKNTNYFHIHKKYAKTFGSKYGGFEKPYFLNIKKIKLINNETIEDIGYWKYIYDDYVNLGFNGVYSEDGQYATLLNPNQIKLADGSNTTFDENNDDIRFELGGIYQGTPHDFEKYSTEYIGTGEGKQVFGWGLYFTDIKDIAKQYTKNDALIYREILKKQKTIELSNIYRLIPIYATDRLKYLKDKLKQFELNKLKYKKNTWDIDIQNYKSLIQIIENYKGKVYSVTLFKGENESDYKLIDWDKSLNGEEFIKILKSLKNFLNVERVDIDDSWNVIEKEQGFVFYNKDGKILTWKDIYIYLSNQLSGDKEASLFLLREGIDGIKYKAGTLSGFENKDGYNYVIFDADDVTIEKKETFSKGGEVNDKYQYVVDEIKKAIIDLELPYLKEVDEFNRYYLSKSKNDFGQSWYIIFLQENRPLEIRISDHSVTSSSRIMDDKYIAMLDVSNPFKYQTPKSIAKSLDLEFKRLKEIAEKRNKLFDEQREKRDYMNNKLQPFLDKLKSENKTIGKNDRTYQTLEEVMIKHPDWEYVFHYPNNGAYSFYFVKKDTNGSLSPNFVNEQYFNFLNDNNYLKTNYKRGGRTIAQTPAPKKERIYGSNTNKEKSSESNTSAKQIVFDEKTLKSIKNKVDKHNEENPDKLITLSSAKAVVRRGMGAYSSSHRPTIKGGKPNSRVAWGLARLNAFIYKVKNGVSKSGKYTQDDDLIRELNIKYNVGGDVSDASYKNVEKDKINYLGVLKDIWSNFNIKF